MDIFNQKITDNKNDAPVISQLAYETAVWYQSSFLQACRFVKAAKKEGFEDPFVLPWETKDKLPFLAEKLFFICSIKQAFEDIKSLNVLLLYHGDNRMDKFKKGLLDEGNLYDRIKVLRNSNEHKIDYMLGEGRQQNQFERDINTDLGSLITNEHMYVHIGKDAFLGEVPLMEMLRQMKKYRDELIQLLNTIHYEYEQRRHDHGQNEI